MPLGAKAIEWNAAPELNSDRIPGTRVGSAGPTQPMAWDSCVNVISSNSRKIRAKAGQVF